MAKFDIDGADELLRRMRELPVKFARRGARRAARRAMIPVRDAARAAARQFDDPNSPKQVWKEIAIAESSRQGKQIGGVVMRVGVRGGARKAAGNVFYWRFLELGTEKIRARPFLRPALENQANAVADNLTRELSKALDEEVAKL